jgi:hypothetical protein
MDYLSLSRQRSGITGRRSMLPGRFQKYSRQSILPVPETVPVEETPIAITPPLGLRPKIFDYDSGGPDDPMEVMTPEKDIKFSELPWGALGWMALGALGAPGAPALGAAKGLKGYGLSKPVGYLGSKLKQHLIDPAARALGLGGEIEMPDIGPTTQAPDLGFEDVEPPENTLADPVDAIAQAQDDLDAMEGIGGMDMDAVEDEDEDGWGDFGDVDWDE